MTTQTTKYLLAARLTARSVDTEVTYLDDEQHKKSLLWIAVLSNYEPGVRGGQWSVGKIVDRWYQIGVDARRTV
jgi:hypothetical protein